MAGKVEDYAVKLVPFDMAGMTGPLQPIAATGGLVFPYTPTVDESVAINYEKSGDLTHTNEQFHVFKNRGNREITLGNCLFTADNEENARYALAAIHFFRSYSMMDYGRGKTARPPSPMWFHGFGPMGFQQLPVLLTGWSIQWDGNTNDLVSISARSPNAPPSTGEFGAFSDAVAQRLKPEDLARSVTETEAMQRRFGTDLGNQTGSELSGRRDAALRSINDSGESLFSSLVSQGHSPQTARAVTRQVMAEQAQALGFSVTETEEGGLRLGRGTPESSTVGGGTSGDKVADTWVPAKFEVTGIKLIVQHSPNWWKTGFSMEDYRSGRMLYEMEATAPGDVSSVTDRVIVDSSTNGLLENSTGSIPNEVFGIGPDPFPIAPDDGIPQ